MEFSLKFSRGPKSARKSVDGGRVRRFAAAAHTRLLNWVLSYQNINEDLKQDAVQMILKSRELAKNNDHITGYLNLMIRNVIGADGFRLQCHSVLPDGKSDDRANALIEAAWHDYQFAGNRYVTWDEIGGGRDFDILILLTYLIDGEVFLRKHLDAASPYGVRYEMIDTLDVDYLYNVRDAGNGFEIVAGIKLDTRKRPVSYFVRRNTSGTYNSGEREEIPADEMVHLYRRFFTNQVRGITPLCATILNVAQLDSYKEAEIVAARLNACNMAFYEKSGAGDFDVDDANADGTVYREYAPGQIGYTPNGYTVKQLQNNHPSGNFATFVKAILRGIAGSLGFSYNKLAGDYESVSYSSLREAALEDRASWAELQAFVIENWKDGQYREFLCYCLLEEKELRFDRFRVYLRHRFHGRTWDWVDPVKDLGAIQMKLQLGLTDPITEIEKLGKDPDEIISRIVLWQKKLADAGLNAYDPAAATGTLGHLAALETAEPNKNGETTENDQ